MPSQGLVDSINISLADNVAPVNIYARRMSPPPSPPRAYHHGNLGPALLEAGLALAREGGPDAVALREVTRRAGVSHNAAYRHFPSRESLLQAVAQRCMARLGRLMAEMLARVAPDEDPRVRAVHRLRVCGEAYVRFALEEPGLFRTAFALSSGRAGPGAEGAGGAECGPGETGGPPGAPDPEGETAPPPGAPDLGADPPGPFAILNRQLDELAATGTISPRRREGGELVAWSAVHGLSLLLLDGPLRDLDGDGRQAAITRVMEGVEQSLGVCPRE
jgi:AcrR family transcriptional regulator